VQQKRFIANIRRSLGVTAAQTDRRRRRLFPVPAAADTAVPGSEDPLAMLDTLTARAQPLNLNIYPQPDLPSTAGAIGALVAEKTPEWGAQKRVAVWDHPLIRDLDLAQVLAPAGVPVTVAPGKGAGAAERAAFRQAVIDAFIGVTAADFLVADTATLVMRTRPGLARSVSLVPVIHVAVVGISRLLPDLRSLYTRLKVGPDEPGGGLTNCMTLISGPSKTADIELVMVHGAHGPRELHLFVVKGQ
jgi:L-lactate dehydrogenase complex protein LldG